MNKTFSTKLDARLLRSLEDFCKRYHLKKSSVLEEIIAEGIQKRLETLELAHSLQKGLAEEARGEFYAAEEVEKRIFQKKKAA